MAITTARDRFTGTHLTDAVRTAVAKVAKRRKISVSHMIFHALEEWLEDHAEEYHREDPECGCDSKTK